MHYFNSLIKPASSLCNMRCGYCFYSDVAEHRDVPSYGLMHIDTAKCFIDRVYEYLTGPTTILFAFQGGEPTLAGLAFFESFVEYAESRKSRHFSISYSIQTNGLLLNGDWCAFFARHHFLVGISLDAAKDVHDFYRKDALGQGTFLRILQSIRLLEKHHVEFNVLSVISREFAKHPSMVFNAFQKHKIEYIQMIPCLNSLEGGHDPRKDLTPKMYATFMKEIFNLWEAGLKKGRIIHIREFDNILSRIQGNRAEQCGMMGYCTPQFVLESDGSVYPCDFYVLDQYKMGSILDNSIAEIEKSEGVRLFLEHEEKRHPQCDTCKVVSICGGGCKRYRSFYKMDPEYCPYQDFLYATVDRFVQIARGMNNSSRIAP